jgi:hypothetical protein
MSSITISDLHFADSKNYLEVLSEQELDTQGGLIAIGIALAILLYSGNAY